MTIAELKHKVYTKALKKYNGNAELAAKAIGVTSRTIHTFKAQQKLIEELNSNMNLIETLIGSTKLKN